MADVSYRASTLRPAQAVGGSIGDFVALMKPRVMSLVVFTALVGMLLAPQPPHPAIAVIALICSAAGAFPPMIGWAASTGTVSGESILLFLIIFMWTPPHFWALALYRMRDYERAGVPMLPVVAGTEETRKQIVIYSALLVPLGLWPAFIGLAGGLYAITSIVLGAVFLAFALAVYR